VSREQPPFVLIFFTTQTKVTDFLLTVSLNLHIFLAIKIRASDIQGIAYVAYLGNILLETSLWLTQGSTRFYFLNKYNPKSKREEQVPSSAKKLRGDIDAMVC
jgi:hypothetical protein